jgi:hypothetical protein
MSYTKVKLKGTVLQWVPSHIFPVYPETSGSEVSQKRINRLKKLACLIIETEEKKIFDAFKQVSKKKGNGVRVVLNTKQAVEKIQNAVLCPANDSMHGESDDEMMWISKNKINDATLLGIMLHESLHYAVTYNSREICTEDEHRAIRLLGDDC